MKTSLIFSIPLSVLIFSGCGGSGPEPEPGSGGRLSALEGAWTTSCLSEEFGLSTESKVVFSGSSYSAEKKSYNNASCSVIDDDLYIYTTSGTFSTGSQITTSSGLNAAELNLIQLKKEGIDIDQKWYDIYRINEGKLYFGDTEGSNDGRSIANRPVDLDFTFVFLKN